MGNAALATADRIERGGRVDYQRIGIRRLRELARHHHPEHTEEAPRAFVMRALDMEVERRTMHDDHLQGYHTHSPMAPGFAPGGTDIAREPLAQICDRDLAVHRDHELVRQFIAWARLPPRQLLAVLIQAAKTERRTAGPRSRSYQQILQDLPAWARWLDIGGSVRLHPDVAPFKDVKALTNAATSARTQLILLASL